MRRLLIWYTEHGAVAAGAVLSGCLALLLRPDDGIRARLAYALSCSGLTLGIFYGLQVIFPSIPEDAAVAVGAFVAFFGVDECKRIVLSLIPQIGNGTRRDPPDRPPGERPPGK